MRENIYKIRKAESTIKQPGFEYLQNGLLCRYNMQQAERTDDNGTTLMWEYDELFISKDIREEEVPELLEKVVLPIVEQLQLTYDEVEITESQKDIPEEFKSIVVSYLRELFA